MLKEQIFQIVVRANCKQGQTSEEATDTIINLFKAEVDKLTVIDCPYKLTNTELLEAKRGAMPATLGKRQIYLEGVNAVKKKLLDLMGE